MLKKLLTGCLTIAMIGAFSASAAAETTFTWSGNLAAILLQQTIKEATTDAEGVTEMDMYAQGDLDLTIVNAGDTWTGTAYFDFDFNSASYGGSDTFSTFAGDIPTDQALGIDDMYVKMSNDTMAISFGEFDPVGIGKGDDNQGDILDNTYGAGGLGSAVPNEQGWLMLSLTDVGLDIFVGLNEDQKGKKSTETGYDASNDGEVASTAYGAKFDKSFGDFALALEYVSIGFKRDEKNGSAVAEDSKWDGASASELALAAQYTMGQMAFTLNYTSATFKSGTPDTDDNKQSWMELVFDMSLSDSQALTAAYGIRKSDAGDSKNYSGSDLSASFKIATGGVNNYISYATSTVKEADADESATRSQLAYTMQVNF